MANYCDCFIQIYNLDENKLLKDYDCVYEEIRTDHDGWDAWGNEVGSSLELGW